MSRAGWLRHAGGGPVRRRHPDALICYPHAGAGAGAYQDWPAQIGGRFDVIAVQPPGRHDRWGEPAPESIEQTAAALTAEIGALAAERVALFGHSYGALVMFETAYAMAAAGRPDPVALIVSGHGPAEAGAPPPGSPEPWFDEALLDLCRELGADEVVEICQDPEIRRLVLPPLRLDMRAVERYRTPDRPPLSVPILVLHGEHDVGTPPQTASQWAGLTTGAVESRGYAGGHFFIQTARSAVLADLDRYLGDPAPARSTADAATVAGVFADVLGRTEHPADLGLGAAGGTSLHAIRIAQRLSDLLAVTVPVATVLNCPTPADLAGALASAPAGRSVPPMPRPAPAPAGDPVEAWPLPTPQRRIWMLHERDPKRLDHLVTVSLELNGAPPPDSIARAWAETIRRHPALRMRVVDGAEPTAVADAPDPGLIHLDAAALPDVIADDLVAEELDRIRRVPVDLRTGPVTRAVLVSRADGTVTLDLVIHHIACDGWSVRVLLDELFARAVADAAGRPAPSLPATVGYPAFARWERQAMSRWPEYAERAVRDLTPVPPRLTLPQANGPASDAVEVGVGKDDAWVKRLRDVFARSSYSPLVLGLVAVAVTLRQLTGQDIMYLAVPLANRPGGFEEVIGDFVNTAIVRVDLSGTGDLSEVLSRTANQAARVYDHPDLPIEEVVARLRAAGPDDDVLPRVAVTVQNLTRHRTEHDSGRLTVTWVEVAERESKYDIVVTIDPADRTQTVALTCAPTVLRTEAATAVLHRIDRALDLVMTGVLA